MSVNTVSGSSPSLKPQPLHSSGVTGCLVLRNPFSSRLSSARGRGEGLKWWRVGGWQPALLADRGWRFGRMDGSQTFYLSFAVPSDTALAPLIGQTPGRSGFRGAQWLAAAAPLCLHWPHEVSPSCHKLAWIARGRCSPSATFLLLVAITYASRCWDASHIRVRLSHLTD